MSELDNLIHALRSRPPSNHLSWPERREIMEETMLGLELPADVTARPESADGVPVEWIETPGARSSKTSGVIVYLHGGGYTLGSIATHRYLMQNVARAAGTPVLGVDYRLAPEHPHPAAVDDATRVVRWLLAGGADPESLVVAGDSAGGGLTLATLIALREAGDPRVAAGILISPWTDLTASGDSITSKKDEDPMVTAEGLRGMARAYVGEDGDLAQPLASPLFSDLSDLPPLFIQVGSAEILLDDAVRLEHRAKAAGVECRLEVWERMFHVFQAFPSLDETSRALDSIGAFVREQVRAG